MNMGFKREPVVKAAIKACADAAASGLDRAALRAGLVAVASDPEAHTGDPIFGALARIVTARRGVTETYQLKTDLKYDCWGEDIDTAAHEQMANACQLPVAVAGALMPDAHLGYGLPIGGVLATDNAVIPYAVGVDIACRMMMTVFDAPADQLGEQSSRFEHMLESKTLFGVGKAWPDDERPEHAVMEEDWNVTPVTWQLKDLAWKQLGTSGSGNHFVEWGELAIGPNARGLREGNHIALLSHSGSRGPGAKVAGHYSRMASDLHPELPKQLSHLAWLPMDGDGAEYWAAMELMGKFASANHHVIHDKIVNAFGADVLFQVENHHNFAWRENHGGRDVIVHRKGATPAGEGVLGLIPGSMAAPGYLVEGLGNKRSLDSASHGAGRRMSRTKAKNSIRWPQLNEQLRQRGVKLLSAGLDESPHAYKDIDEVMAAQESLVRPLAKFMPRIVKMAPGGERPED